MKKTSFAPVVIALMAMCVSASAQKNPYETLQGNVNLKGLGVINKIAYSDVKVSVQLGAQESGPQVNGPAVGQTVAVDGVAAKLVKLTNKQILEAAGLDPKGKKIRWARTSAGAVLEAYDKNGPIQQIPAAILTADVSWANNYTGIYGGGADLTATSTASGTQVFVSSGKLNGLTALAGSALGYIQYVGVGKFTTDAKKQLSANVRVSGIGSNPSPES